MFLKLLNKLGRKKLVLDRGSTHTEFDKAKAELQMAKKLGNEESKE